MSVQEALRNLLNHILHLKTEAGQQGFLLDIMVVPRASKMIIFSALAEHDPVLAQCYSLKPSKTNPNMNDLYLHGVKVVWNGDRLHGWYRYSRSDSSQETTQ